MNANEFFENHSIEEINKKTKISPISLRYIKNKEFKKLQRVKFLGFIRIIEKEYKIDLSELIEEYNDSTKETTNPINETPKIKEPKKNNTILIFILAIILLLLGGYLLYKNYTQPTKQNIKESYTLPKTNKTIVNNTIPQNQFNSISINDNNSSQENNISNIVNKKTNIPSKIIITPNQKVWYKAVNLDTNKTIEYLTSNTKTLYGANWYIKFGHGNITIKYGDKNITPNTKKIVRILFKEGNITYLKKHNRYEK